MRLLLDTHAFLWAYSEPDRLPTKVRDTIVDIENDVFVSAVSFLEISIKISIGKLKPIGNHPKEILDIAEALGFRPIPLLPDEAANYTKLTEDTHFDPFDRMLIWQAIDRGLTLVSRDKEFKKFKKDGLKLLWK
ncbi:MAG TPA: type II toxin-antitoxin system VapC family toxin [Pyrinomonadaceae bacterium]|nr:type II toxin-antitoxin system VapC family toxin [Pyrinomonadaceae bacterium]